jgi:hypothetical protein
MNHFRNINSIRQKRLNSNRGVGIRFEVSVRVRVRVRVNGKVCSLRKGSLRVKRMTAGQRPRYGYRK